MSKKERSAVSTAKFWQDQHKRKSGYRDSTGAHWEIFRERVPLGSQDSFAFYLHPWMDGSKSWWRQPPKGARFPYSPFTCTEEYLQPHPKAVTAKSLEEAKELIEHMVRAGGKN